jgi:hypothetical protein
MEWIAGEQKETFLRLWLRSVSRRRLGRGRYGELQWPDQHSMGSHDLLGFLSQRGRASDRITLGSVALPSMGCGRLSGRLETLNEHQQKNRRQRQPCNDTEAIHKRQQTHLMLKLLVEVTLRGGRGIRT